MCVGVRQRRVGMCVCQVDRGRQQILTQTCQGGGAKGGTEPESGLSNWIPVTKKTPKKRQPSMSACASGVCPCPRAFQGEGFNWFCVFCM